jgi:hypothetical protein
MAEESSSSSVNGGQHHAPPLNKGYQNDILNPYFMHPNENPSNVLATPLLSGPNYHSWSRSVMLFDPRTRCTSSMVHFHVLMMMIAIQLLGIGATP